ncbi:uncharacterized protein LOC133726869 [Rosa rugosa]|uniref:uncharacterized protein LOC133726869 n=1 Tax=Rosa rugosa TaxID=74645 RepID=UPI002B40284E|nr:uncharacterized protein LOC133726869 [Rosa rugosa]
MKREHMLLTLLISWPKQPGNDIDVYLEPLIDDLKLLWEGVSGVYDARQSEYFTLRGLLFWTINDFPAYGNLSGSIVKGYNACHICLEKTKPTRLVNGGKMAYIVHRRFLGRNHPYRRQKVAFDNFPEHSPSPVPLSGEEVLERVEQEFLPVRHCLDVMHIEKNVCDSLIGTLLNIPGKTKDGVKTQLDLVEMGIRLGLRPDLEGPKERLPMVPEDYSSNISNLVSMDDLRLGGLKSYDCHALMQQLLPVAIRGVLEKSVGIVVIRLCLFFNEICRKTIDVSRLQKIQSELVETLCELEKYFPPSFFDIMVHLTVHLVREVELLGPVCFQWIYPFEKYMKICKGYVRNRNRLEGCIAKCCIAEETVEFLAELFIYEKIVGIPSDTHKEDKPTLGATIVSIYGKIFDQVHLYVLQNTDEFRSYFVISINTSCKVAVQLSEPNANILQIIRWLSDKPRNEVPTFSGYRIAGVQYNTNKRDDLRSTQNSSVYLLAETLQHIFYVQNPIDPMWSVVLRILARDYNDFEVEDELGDTVIAHHPITTIMPSIELPSNLPNEDEVGYMREGEEDIVVDG